MSHANTYSFIPTLFDARFNGCYSFASVLEYHKSIEHVMPQDGLIWLCEHPDMSKLLARKAEILNDIRTIQEGMKGQPYLVWTTLDKMSHTLSCRLQLVTLCIDSLKAN